MSADILAGLALALLASMVVLTWIVWRGSARAATLEDIAARMAKDAGNDAAAAHGGFLVLRPVRGRLAPPHHVPGNAGRDLRG